jgi:DNA-binding transcriptional MerR regulator
MFGETYPDSGSNKNFYRIGEVSRLTDTKPFVLRYWETEYPSLQPVKSAKGQRLYRREDVETVLRIKRLLYDQGFTIAGARRLLREEGGPGVDMSEAVPLVEDPRDPEARFADESAEALSSQDRAIEQPSANGDDLFSAVPVAPKRRAEPVPTIGRNVLIELRDSLRAFLTLLENE